MDKTVRIMVLIGSNGRVSACIEGDMGWGDLADNIADYSSGRGVVDPEAEGRHIVIAQIPVPVVTEIAGTVSSETPSHDQL